MRTTRHTLWATVLGSALLLIGSSAWAGSSSIFTGGILIFTGQFVRCGAVNVSSSALESVTVRLRNDAGVVNEATCEGVEPLSTCLTAASGEALGVVFCEATSSRGGKSLRATLVNEDGGLSSDAR